MKLFKLIVHQKTFSSEDLIINPKDFPNIKKGDIVEIYHPEDEFSRLLLQVTSVKEDLQGKETISIEQSIALAFQLRTYADVFMNVVDPETVALDSVEFTFRDQYLGRSEMWRLKNNLVNTCVYLNKKIEFCGNYLRCQVCEMWSSGERVACGVINDSTKVVFRSLTSMVYLFIQMSSEMWDFDIHGDLYFEKAVNGFLADLFQKWKKNGSNHEVTIVLFSRTFYKAHSLEEFPSHMRECLQQDYKGRFYEDFYRVAVQNEKYEDWSSTLVELRRLFTDYQRFVLEYHHRPGVQIPKAVNSTAAQGNFLEVLNMSLNVFEKHYLDRSFDRTGQLSVVITPGVGVFEVDRQLTNITKQRIIDNGVGSDLVCIGEQPLHAVPLLKFHNKDTSINAVDDYSMPHWINLSFYSTNKKVAYSNFTPRIKLPPRRHRTTSQTPQLLLATVNSTGSDLGALPTTPTPKAKLAFEDEMMPESSYDYDTYDAQVFQLPQLHTTRFSRHLQRPGGSSRTKKGSITLEGSISLQPSHRVLLRRKTSDPDIHHLNNGEVIGVGSPTNGHCHKVQSNLMAPSVSPTATPTPSPMSPTDSSSVTPRSAAITIPQMRSTDTSPQPSSSINNMKQRVLVDLVEGETSPPMRMVAGSVGSPLSPTPISPTPISPPGAPLLRPGRALINPFDPSHVTIKLTSNRRRWTHIFPKGPSGVLIQQHHYQAIPTSGSSDQASSGLASSRSRTQTRQMRAQDAAAQDVAVQDSATQDAAAQDAAALDTTAQDACQTCPPGGDSSSKSKAGHMTRSASQIAFQDHVRGRSIVPSLHSGDRLPSNGTGSKTLLWGATGEQEWTPALTTGVDWKSLTISACLPITTDYFPDKRSLQNDYLVSDYNLLPDDVNADYAQQRAIYRKPLTTAEVFRELVSQRLAQGFQLIVTNKEKCALSVGQGGAETSSIVGPRTSDIEPIEEYLLSIGRIFHRISLKGSCITVTRYRPRHPYPPFNFHYRYRFQAPDHESYETSWVSFTTEKLENFKWNYLDHYICTRGDTDFVFAEALKYWRFRVYLLPISHLATKRIMDGSEHCDIYSPLSKEDKMNCVKGFLRFVEQWVNRVRRLTPHKKPREPLMVAVAVAHNQLNQQLTRRRHSTSLAFLSSAASTQSSVVGNSPFRERLGSNRQLEKPSRPRSGSKVLDRAGRVSAANESNSALSGTSIAGPAINGTPLNGSALTGGALTGGAGVTVASCTAPPGTAPSSTVLSSDASLSEHQDWLDDSTSQAEPRLKSGASPQEIVEAMAHPVTGVGFLTQHPSLPSHTFVSFDAVGWLISHVEGVTCEHDAISLLKVLLKERLICHASGDFSHPIKVGFYLYHVVQDPDKEGEAGPAPLGDLKSFENEWLEVEVKYPANLAVSISATNSALAINSNQSLSPATPPYSCSDNITMPKFLQDDLGEPCQEDGVDVYKNIHLETDVNNKSDRVEWGHCRYQSVYRAERAYELVVQWVCSSGPIVAELLLVWARKAPPCHLQMVPIPADPMALPYSYKSDPLRGPVFVPLDTDCLMGSKSYLFQEFPEDSWPQRLFLFQESIAFRFGFIACAMESSDSNHQGHERGKEKQITRHHHQYVHMTGNMFLLIPSPPCQRSHSHDVSIVDDYVKESRFGNTPAKRYNPHPDTVSSPHEEYITRHVSGNTDYGPDHKVGFLWSWNHMLSRRLKTSTNATGDENFQNKMLKDFREFCGNRDNRLRSYWDACWALRDH